MSMKRPTFGFSHSKDSGSRERAVLREIIEDAMKRQQRQLLSSK
jgi:hypothetical protein